MPEGMGMNVGKTVFLTELSEPVGDAVRMHEGAFVLCKDESVFCPGGAALDFQFKLLGLPAFQNRNAFRCNADGSGLAVLGGADVDALFLGVQQSLLDHHGSFPSGKFYNRALDFDCAIFYGREFPNVIHPKTDLLFLAGFGF